MVCAGCGAVAPAGAPFRCPEAGASDDVDHVLGRELDLERVRFPSDDSERSSFVRYRALTHAYHTGRAGGLEDDDLVALFRDLDGRVAALASAPGVADVVGALRSPHADRSAGFAVTPLRRAPALAERLGLDLRPWIKDERANVGGSHKGRHLMGVALWLDVAERVGLWHGAPPRLAISSCGNAALAAAVVARAARRPLTVFIPRWASDTVEDRLTALGADVERCDREPGETGDPCTRAFREAVALGAVPFSCQGTDDGLAVEGGTTLGYELADQLRSGGETLDRIFVQVGGGALASAVAQALREAARLGVIERLPRVHAVQTVGGHPLVRAWDRLTARMLCEEASLGLEPAAAAARAARVAALPRAAIDEALRWAAAHRSALMWPWETEPKSVATGILDDETYDWLAVTRAMIDTGGHPVIATEPELEEAHAAVAAVDGVAACPTGSAGLAGLVALARAGGVEPGERVGVLITGYDR